MSTAQEIWETYRDEIVEKSRLVYRKGGAKPFFTDDNLRIQTPFQVPDDDIYCDFHDDLNEVECESL
jgi:hypothetical protein